MINFLIIYITSNNIYLITKIIILTATIYVNISNYGLIIIFSLN